MKLSDLKTGMHVILRGGDEYIVLKDTCLIDSFCINDNAYHKNIIKRLNGGSYTSLNNYNEDFTNANELTELDIVEVYTCDCDSAILKSVKDEPDSFARIFVGRPIMTREEVEEKFGIKIVD